jgi:hypothetical protein
MQPTGLIHTVLGSGVDFKQGHSMTMVYAKSRTFFAVYYALFLSHQ